MCMNEKEREDEWSPMTMVEILIFFFSPYTYNSMTCLNESVPIQI